MAAGDTDKSLAAASASGNGGTVRMRPGVLMLGAVISTLNTIAGRHRYTPPEALLILALMTFYIGLRLLCTSVD